MSQNDRGLGRRAPLFFLATALVAGTAVSNVAQAQLRPEAAPLSGTDLISEALAAGGKIRVIVDYKGHGPSPIEARGFGELASRSAQLNAAHAGFLSSIGRSMSDPDVSAMPLTPQIAITVTTAELAALKNNPLVERVHVDEIRRPNLRNSTVLMRAPYAWYRSGTGFGWSVAVLDTGSNLGHEFLARAGSTEACYSTNTSFSSGGQNVTVSSLCPGGVTQSTSAGSARDCNSNQITGCGHGTHVAGIAVGRNTSLSAGEPLRGMAYESPLIAVNVFSRFSGNYCGQIGYPGSRPCVLTYSSDQIKGLQRVLALSIAGRRVASVNMSLGGGRYTTSCNSDPLRPTIISLRNRNIATVIAAGNNGYPNAVGAPSCITEAITVAASTKNDTFASYTNYSAMVDIIATGSSIVSSYRTSTNTTRFYATLSGTSMAAPHVAGFFAMMKDRFPNATVSQIEAAMKACGPTGSINGVVRRRLDVQCAYVRLDAILP